MSCLSPVTPSLSPPPCPRCPYLRLRFCNVQGASSHSVRTYNVCHVSQPGEALTPARGDIPPVPPSGMRPPRPLQAGPSPPPRVGDSHQGQRCQSHRQCLPRPRPRPSRPRFSRGIKGKYSQNHHKNNCTSLLTV